MCFSSPLSSHLSTSPPAFAEKKSLLPLQRKKSPPLLPFWVVTNNASILTLMVIG